MELVCARGWSQLSPAPPGLGSAGGKLDDLASSRFCRGPRLGPVCSLIRISFIPGPHLGPIFRGMWPVLAHNSSQRAGMQPGQPGQGYI